MKVVIVSNGVITKRQDSEDFAFHVHEVFKEFNHQSKILIHGTKQERNELLHLWRYGKRKLYAKTKLEIFNSKNDYFKNKHDNILIEEIVTEQPDLVLVLKGMFLTKDVFLKLKKLLPKTKFVNVCFDNIFLYTNVFACLPEYDLFYVSDSYLIERLNRLGQKNARFVPMGVNLNLYPPLSNEVKAKTHPNLISDISIVGGFYPYRAMLMDALDGFDFKWWGPINNTEQFSDFYNTYGWKNHQKRPVGGLDKKKIFSCSKINLTTHDPIESIRSDNTRIYQVAALKGFQLVEYNEDLSKFFTLGEDLIVFYDTKDLREKVQYYLEHEDERNRIAELTYQRVKKDHTYQKRIELILEELNISK